MKLFIHLLCLFLIRGRYGFDRDDLGLGRASEDRLRHQRIYNNWQNKPKPSIRSVSSDLLYLSIAHVAG